jgi:hypothetical protein
MTAVLPTSSLSGYTHDASTLLSISDTDNESSYSPNAASPLILIPGAPSPGAGSCSRTTSGLFSGTRNGRDNMSSSTTGPNDYSSSHRGRCRGEPAGCETRHSSTHEEHEEEQERERAQLSIVAMLLDTVRRSLMASCQAVEEDAPETLEIGWPTDVQHVAHVTFDRYNGFLGLPEEFVVEVPPRAPSASQNVFGVSAESMQCAFDSKGNSVPMILLLMQERLYHEGGLKAEGIFRINAENSHEEHVRDQLNKGIVPADIDVHCLAGLIKAWFRELPQGILDVFTADQVMDCNTEEESVALVRLLPPTQAALLDWAVNLMADVVQQESSNKMNARNIAMVFAPNMTQMADPLTALMHAVQVMNLLKTLIIRTLRDRQEPVLEDQHGAPAPETSEGDEPDSDSGGVLLNGHERHSSAPTVDTKVGYDQYSHRIIIPPKRGSSKAKPKSGRLVNTIDQHNERVEAW